MWAELLPQIHTVKTAHLHFYPFFDPYLNGKLLSWPQKIAVSVAYGGAYSALQYWNLNDKAVFFDQACWILSVIMSTSLLALYMATAVFRNNLSVVHAHEHSSGATQYILSKVMVARNYLLSGIVLGLLTSLVSGVLGIPAALGDAKLVVVSYYLGGFITGFTAGMGLWGIFSVIALYLQLAPNLQYTLDPEDPDGLGGIKALGDSLWIFASLIVVVGLLVALYMFSVDWNNLTAGLGRMLFLLWLALPFVLAVSIVLIPGLAVGRQVDEFKQRRQEELKRERASVYSSYKEFEPAGDEEIIASKKALQDRLNRIQKQMDLLQLMRKSPLESRKRN